MSDYTLKALISSNSEDEEKIITQYPLTNKDQWTDKRYDPIKSRIKKELYFNQFDRCAYCRKTIEADGKYEPMDHIVAKSIRPEWMLEPENLIVTCDSCNNLKNNDPTLSDLYTHSVYFPKVSEAYIVFNPHFDSWADHLRYDHDIFLVGIPGSKGPDTVKICRLFRYNIIINRAKELKLQQKTPLQRSVFRLNELDVNSSDFSELKDELIKAMTHFISRTLDNPDFSN